MLEPCRIQRALRCHVDFSVASKQKEWSCGAFATESGDAGDTSVPDVSVVPWCHGAMFRLVAVVDQSISIRAFVAKATATSISKDVTSQAYIICSNVVI